MIDLKENQIKWVLFIIFIFTLPTFYFLFLAVGFWPLAIIYAGFVFSFFNGGFPGATIVNLIHGVLYTFPIYYLSVWISKSVFRVSVNKSYVFMILVILIIGIILAVSAPIYDVSEQWPSGAKNLYKFYSSILF